MIVARVVAEAVAGLLAARPCHRIRQHQRRALPARQIRIGPSLLAAELAACGALAIVAARAAPGWELAALAWLAMTAVPLALIDLAVHRLRDKLTAAACAGTLALLTVAALTAHQPHRLARAAIRAAALACFYLM